MFHLVALIRAVEMSANRHYDSVWDSIYWFAVTIATVGYGDITPRTTEGKLLTIPLIMIGVILMNFLTGTIASILTATRIREGRGLQKLNLQNHVVICGYNSNIERVIGGIVSTARSLPDIVLINTHPETEITNLIERFSQATIRFVRGDYTAEPYGIPRLALGEGIEILLPGFIPVRPGILAWFLGRLERKKIDAETSSA